MPAAAFFMSPARSDYCASGSLSRLHALTKPDSLGLGIHRLGLPPPACWTRSRMVVVWALVSASRRIDRRS